ncbi:MAG TPA: hypothetical protein VFF48_12425 [Brevundimonas sp.]|nr:hypothetical protein [Brevundimonas sp.]
MVGKFQRRNNRKARLSGWFAHERDRDMQVFDIGTLTFALRLYVSALWRELRVRRSRSAEQSPPGPVAGAQG